MTMTSAWQKRAQCIRNWLGQCQASPEVPIEQGARAMHATAVRILEWLTGRDLVPRDDSRPSGIPPLATLLGLAIAQGIALLVVNYEGGSRSYSLFVFGLVAIIVIGGM